MKNISKFDYILWDTKNDKPIEDLDIVHHYTSVIELINDGFKLQDGEQFICVAELPYKWQYEINNEIEKYK
jgi:hypothetical protein